MVVGVGVGGIGVGVDVGTIVLVGVGGIGVRVGSGRVSVGGLSVCVHEVIRINRPKTKANTIRIFILVSPHQSLTLSEVGLVVSMRVPRSPLRRDYVV